MFDHRAFWLAKDIRRGREYEDAFRVNAEAGLAAIADGVSASFRAGTWANLLVGGAVSDMPDHRDGRAMAQWLAGLRKRWQEGVDVAALAWHQRAKMQEGASATLLRVQLQPVDQRGGRAKGAFRLKALAVGDCCLFHCRGGQTLRCFPIEQSGQFDTQPKVVRSAAQQAIEFDALEDYCEPGDLLVLATDAVAAWALALLESGSAPDWDAFWNMNEDEWERAIDAARQQHLMRYDDATLVLLRVVDGDPPPEAALRRSADAPKTAKNWTEDIRRKLSELPNLFGGRR